MPTYTFNVPPHRSTEQIIKAVEHTLTHDDPTVLSFDEQTRQLKIESDFTIPKADLYLLKGACETG